MTTLNDFITFENTAHRIEHDLEHDLAHKLFFSVPKIYNARGNLSKRWYVYFSFRNPETGKLERQQNIYGKANLYKTKEDRLAVLSSYRKNLLKLLKEGYSPFSNNLETITSTKKNDAPKAIAKSEQNGIKEIPRVNSELSTGMPLKDAFDFGLKLKENIVSARTIADYKYKIRSILLWIKEEHPEILTIEQLTKKIVVDFLNSILIKASPRSRNNYRLEIGSIMQTLEDNEIMSSNFMKKIPPLKAKPERNKTYTLEVQENIFNYLDEKDPLLLLFIKFISFNFLRPVEVCRLRIKDIDLINKTIQFKAKNSPLKTKIIPELLLVELPDLSEKDPEDFLFTAEQIGGAWHATETNRRDHFSKRFKTVVKDHFKLGKDYTLYSFRHTYITKLYRAFAKDSTPYEAKSKLMVITGHSSMNALDNYLRDIDAVLPEDYSEML